MPPETKSFKFPLATPAALLSGDAGGVRRWQTEGEGSSGPQFALDPDPPAVQLDESLRQREAQSSPFTLGRPLPDLTELLEDVLPVLRADPDPGVGDRNPNLVIHRVGRDLD